MGRAGGRRRRGARQAQLQQRSAQAGAPSNAWRRASICRFSVGMALISAPSGAMTCAVCARCGVPVADARRTARDVWRAARHRVQQERTLSTTMSSTERASAVFTPVCTRSIDCTASRNFTEPGACGTMLRSGGTRGCGGGAVTVEGSGKQAAEPRTLGARGSLSQPLLPMPPPCCDAGARPMRRAASARAAQCGLTCAAGRRSQIRPSCRPARGRLHTTASATPRTAACPRSAAIASRPAACICEAGE